MEKEHIEKILAAAVRAPSGRTANRGALSSKKKNFFCITSPTATGRHIIFANMDRSYRTVR